MAVGKALTYTDNQVLNTEGHSKNVYDADGNTGIMSESNGGLGTNNLDANFVAHAEHVFPETVAFGRQEGMTEPIQCFSDKYGSQMTTTASIIGSGGRYRDFIRPIPGCGIRVYLPYDASVVLWQWSYFINPQLIMAVPGCGTYFSASDPDAVTFNGFLALKRDGVLIESTIRGLPPSLFYNNSETDSGHGRLDDESVLPGFRSRTARASVWRDMHYLDTSASYLAKGWHDIQLCMHLEHTAISSTITDNQDTGAFASNDNVFNHTLIRGGEADNNEAKASNAAVFGIRNARALVLY
jgi:hypothetical protein